MLDTYANRVRFVRSLTKLSREAFEVRYGINRNTIKSWELGVNTLTEKSAKALSDAIIEEGFSCSPYWLIFGQGAEPRPLSESDEEALLQQFDEQSKVIYEADFFKRNNPNSTVCMITDKSMSPKFNLTDYVGGININNIKNITACVGAPCIVTLKDDLVIVRNVVFGKNDSIILCPLNTSYVADVISKEDITTIANIVWHRTTSLGVLNE